MENEYSQVARTLRWACTGQPLPADCPQDLILSAVVDHKIPGRFLAQANKQDLIAQSVVEKVETIQREHLSIAKDVEADENWLTKQIVSHSDWDGKPFLALKGNAASYLTGNTASRRVTRDIDLLTSNPALYRDILESIGYHSRGDNFGGHEAANLVLTGHCDIDLHRYCPSWRYPTQPYSERPATSTELIMIEWVYGDALGYDAILEDSVSHPASDCSSLRLPSVTVSALIICLEIFRDYVAGNREIALVRLSDLCEVVELLRAEGFDLSRFRRLVSQCRAHDSVSFVSNLIDELFAGEDVLALGYAIRKSYPRMTGIGQLFDAQPHFVDLLVPRDNFGEVFHHAGCNRMLQAGGSSVIRARAHDVTIDGHPAYAVRSAPLAPRDESVEFDCTVDVSDRGVTIEIRGLNPPGPFREIIKLYFKHGTIVTSYDGYRSAPMLPPSSTDCVTTWDVSEDGWTVHLVIPWGAIKKYGTSSDTIPIIIHCCTFLDSGIELWDDYFRRGISSLSIPAVLPTSRLPRPNSSA